MVSFLHSVSCDYHRNRAGVGEAKNNGSRPMSSSDAEEKIRQRAVALLGGGINTAVSTTKKQVRPKKRRHRSWEEKKDVLEKFSSRWLATGSDDVVSFLQKLNAAWNQYVCKLLLNDKELREGKALTDVSLQQIEGRLVSLMQTGIDGKKTNHGIRGSTRSEACESSNRPFEMIGSHIQIKCCNAHRSWIGRFGVVVGETTNTYRIAGLSRRKPKRKAKRIKDKATKVRNSITDYEGNVETPTPEATAGDSVQETGTDKLDSADNESKTPFVEVFLLPKRGSSFQLIIPVPSLDQPNNDLKDDDSDLTETVDSEDSMNSALQSIIAIPAEAIGISITDPYQPS